MAKKAISYLMILVILFSLSISIAGADKPGTCKNPSGGNYCSKKSAVSSCYCDKACTNAEDCCTDYKEVCLSSGGGGGGNGGGTEKSFRYATWQCYDGYSEKQGSPSSCKTSQTWKGYAEESCKGRCNPDESKCGVNSFGVDTECTDTIKAVCGNNICEQGEAGYCPPCTKANPPCLAPCTSGTCPQDCTATEVKEQVKCDFEGSISEQTCSYLTYPGTGKGGCTGLNSCVATVSGKKYEQVKWESTCGGTAYTTLDGVDEYAYFKCSSQPKCTDSDGGIDYYKKGFMKGGYNDLGQWDSCYNDKQLVEYYCDESGGKKVLYKCPNACEDGACIFPTPKPIITKQDVINWIDSNCGEKG